MPRATAINDKTLRHLAIQLAAQLPSDPDEARRVLCLCRELVDKFMAAEDRKTEPALKLVCAIGQNPAID